MHISQRLLLFQSHRSWAETITQKHAVKALANCMFLKTQDWSLELHTLCLDLAASRNAPLGCMSHIQSELALHNPVKSQCCDLNSKNKWMTLKLAMCLRSRPAESTIKFALVLPMSNDWIYFSDYIFQPLAFSIITFLPVRISSISNYNIFQILFYTQISRLHEIGECQITSVKRISAQLMTVMSEFFRQFP